MSIEKFKPSYDIYPERIERLKAVAPEAFADGKINWDILKESLGSFVEDEGAETEHYAFTWPGKREARRMAGKPPQGTLVPVPGEGVNENASENIFIEGDNLEVLKLLQKSYAGKIKMIYIDPPYNTGNDFIYNDNFTQPLDEYLKMTGQTDAQGNALVSNKKADGRFHSKWINMIYPRILLAKNLLREDGIIFISIDDNEMDNLKKVCIEIFGEENFMSTLVWKKKYTGGKHTKGYVDLHEYILVFSKSIDAVPELLIDRPDDEKEKFTESDEFENERGKYYVRPLKSNLEERKTLVYPIKMPDGSNLETQWLVSKDRFEKEFAEKRIIFRQKRDGEWQVYKKYYEKDSGGKVKPPSLIEKFPNTEAKFELKELFNIEEGRDNVFYTVKPTGLLKYLFQYDEEKGGIILDFFSGVASTAHAVLDLNFSDKGSRKFILVQIPEPCDDKNFKNIAEIGKERVRRVIKKIKAESKSQEIKDQDNGFKVFKLQKSHFIEWQDYKGSDVKELMDLFAKQEDALVAGWKPENLIVEVMLQEGFPLHSKIEPMEAIKANKVVQVKSEFCQHVIFICLDEKVDKKTIEQLPLTEKDIFICLDKALTDEQKVALSDKGVIKTI